ncbi:MAG: alginate O-acetyltransferase AlgX-related protein [Gammaproteobacteria bacterium]
MRISSLFPGHTPFYANDPDLGFRLRPHVSIGNNETNSFGFNDIDHEPRRNPKNRKIVFIGDSFVYGMVARQDNFVFVVEDLAKNAGIDVEVWNMGIPAAGPENYLRLINRESDVLDANLICVMFFIGNDIKQSHPDFKTRVWFGAPREILRSPYLLGFSLEYSYVYRLLRAGSRYFLDRASNVSASKGETFSEESYLSIEYQRSKIYKTKLSPKEVEDFNSAKTILKQIAVQAAARQRNFLLVLAPDELQVNPQLRAELLRRFELDPIDYDFAQPQKILLQFLHSEGIEVLDLLPDFVDSGTKETLYLKNDSHWNVAGNHLAARAIWTRMEEMVARNQ